MKKLLIIAVMLSLSLTAVTVKAEEGSDDVLASSTRPRLNPFRQELRQDVQGIRKDLLSSSTVKKDLREENKNIRNEILKDRGDIQGLQSQFRGEAKDMRADLKTLKASGTVPRPDFKVMRADMVERVKEMRGEMKDKVQAIRSDVKMSRENRLGNIASILEIQVNTLESASTRIKAKIDSISATSSVSQVNLEEARKLLGEADSAIAKSKTLLANLKTASSTLNASSTSAQIVEVRRIANEIVKSNNQAKELLIRALNRVRQSVMPGTRTPRATSTNSTSTVTTTKASTTNPTDTGTTTSTTTTN